jgi:hypothetical protein
MIGVGNPQLCGTPREGLIVVIDCYKRFWESRKKRENTRTERILSLGDKKEGFSYTKLRGVEFNV